MHTKQNSIRNLPTIRPELAVQGMGGPIANGLLRGAVWTKHASPYARARIGVSLRSANDQAAELWETVSHAVLWLCGSTALWGWNSKLPTGKAVSPLPRA